jgi:hypothetical protein
MKTFFNIFLFLIISTNCYSQTGEINITGKITDINNKPLSSASIKNLSKGTVVISDQNGRYTFKGNETGFKLQYSYLGYISITKTITASSLKNKDSLSLDIVLEKSASKLKEVEITSSKGPEIAYGNSKLYVQDYEFYNNSMLILTLEKNKQYLKLINENDSALFSEPMAKEVKFLWKDCMENIFLIGKDSLYKIELSSLHFYIDDRLPAVMFYSSLYPCVLSLSGNLYLQEFKMHNQAISYYKVNKRTKKRPCLIT